MNRLVQFGKNRVKKFIQWKFRECKKTYGKLNPNKIFYVIRTRRAKVGLMSYYHNVLIQIEYALENNYIPVVDMKNYKNTYLDKKKFKLENSWEYYFKQPYNISLDEVYKSKNVILSDGEMPITTAPRHLYYDIYNNPELANKFYDIINKYMTFSDEFEIELEKTKSNILPNGKRILGVVSRETDMINFPNHSKMPTIDYLLQETKKLMDKYNCEYIFIASDKDSSIKFFQEHLGRDKVLFNEARRFDSYKKKGNKVLGDVHFERENDAYLKGKEYLITVALLSKCNCLFGSLVGATLGALSMNCGKYEHVDIFDNGIYK